MCAFFFCGALPCEARLRLVLRNSGVTAEINASQSTAGLASHHRRWSHEDWGRAVQKPSEKQKVQHQGNAERGSLTFRNAGIKLREHGPLRTGSLYSTHSLAKISKVIVGAEPELAGSGAGA